METKAKDLPEFYGRCDASSTPELEALLALCRVCHCRYAILRTGEFWSVELSTYEPSPDDFFAASRPSGMRGPSRRCFVTLCIREERAIPGALMSSFSSLVFSLRNSCEHWRRIASTHPDYKNWPQFQ